MLYSISNYYSYCCKVSTALCRAAAQLLPQKVTLGRKLVCQPSRGWQCLLEGRVMVWQWLFLPFDEGNWPLNYSSVFGHWRTDANLLWSSFQAGSQLHLGEECGMVPQRWERVLIVSPLWALFASRFYNKCVLIQQVLGVFEACTGFCVLKHSYTFWDLPADAVTKITSELSPHLLRALTKSPVFTGCCHTVTHGNYLPKQTYFTHVLLLCSTPLPPVPALA